MLKLDKIKQSLSCHDASRKILYHLEKVMQVSPTALFDIRSHMDILFSVLENDIVVQFHDDMGAQYRYNKNFSADHESLDDICVWLLSCHIVSSQSTLYGEF